MCSNNGDRGGQLDGNAEDSVRMHKYFAGVQSGPIGLLSTGASSVISAAHRNAADSNENEAGNPSSAESVPERRDTSVIAARHHDASRAGASTTGPLGCRCRG